MGKLKNIIKKTALYKLYCKIHTFLFDNPTELGTIYMLHRVDTKDEQKLSANENMKVSPEFLERFINRLKEQGVRFLKLEDLPKYAKKYKKEKFVVFTMDDGYKDNYTQALPVFKKQNVPYTIFLTTDFPDNKAVLWWYELEELLLKNTEVILSNGNTYSARTREEKEASFLEIRSEILKLNQLDIINELNSLFSNYSINWTQKCRELCLSWDDVNSLKKEKLVTIGAHTEHHYNLKQLETMNDVKNEVLSGMKRCKQQTDLRSNVFAYPFGYITECGEREFNALSELPFKLAVRSYGGTVRVKDLKNLYSLPREFLTEDYVKEYLKS